MSEREASSAGSWNEVEATSQHEAEQGHVEMKRSQAIAWFTGEGAATEQAVKEAEDQLKRQGGKLAACCGLGCALVDHKGYATAEWNDVVPGLALELGLSEQQTEALKNAGRREEGRAAHFSQHVQGDAILGRHMAYWTLRHGDRINIVYGKHEEAMQMTPTEQNAARPPTPLAPENCIQHGGRTFSVLPQASPHNVEAGQDMIGKVVEIPAGWQVVDSSQEGFESIRTQVIAPYGWKTCVLVTKGAEGQPDGLHGWQTKYHNANAGVHWQMPSGFVAQIDASRYRIDKGSVRLLIELKPCETPSPSPPSHELASTWKRFVQLSAQRDWSQRLTAQQ